MLVLTWNLFHGRAKPAAGRPLLVEFARTIASWEWDVALLQEVPPWWAPMLAHAAGAQHRTALTSRNSLLALRRAIAVRNPDLIASNGGSANAILSRGAVADHREAELTRRPERRVAHGVRLAQGGGWVVNLHATKDPKTQTRADVAAAREHALAWAGGEAVVLGGDVNTRHVDVPGFVHVAGEELDRIYARGWVAAGPAETLDGPPEGSGTLSDHRPVRVALQPETGGAVSPTAESEGRSRAA